MAGYYWLPWQPGQQLPPRAVEGGVDSDGSTIYVGRAYHEGDLIPAKVIPNRNQCYLAYGGLEVCLAACEVLCQQSFIWVPCSGGIVPDGAVVGGHTADGETLYIGRVYHEGSHTVGKVHPSHNTCYIPFGGQECGHDCYEVLALQN
ncbi:uncharacterized protein CBL_06930 [Carabus blaptoides fortunei]